MMVLLCPSSSAPATLIGRLRTAVLAASTVLLLCSCSSNNRSGSSTSVFVCAHDLGINDDYATTTTSFRHRNETVGGGGGMGGIVGPSEERQLQTDVQPTKRKGRQQQQQRRSRLTGGAAVNLRRDDAPAPPLEQRRASSCQDSPHPFVYTSKHGTVMKWSCAGLAKMKEKGFGDKVEKRCKWGVLNDDITHTVADKCPVTCGAGCGDDGDGDDSGGPSLTTTAPPGNPGGKDDGLLDKYPKDIVGRVDSRAKCPPPKYDGPPVLMFVTNRDVYHGCHSFERSLSPKFRTVFVLNEQFAKMWNLDDLVRNAKCSESAGATLLMTNKLGGELLGRIIALDFALRNRAPDGSKFEFILHKNCDVHEIPKTHRWYRSMEKTVIKMARDFEMVRAQRDPKSHKGVHYPNFQLVKNYMVDDKLLKVPILAMSVTLFEGFKDDNDLTSETHGNDNCRWKRNGARSARPKNLGDTYPWLCTDNKWENHMAMFDLRRLEQVRHEYLDVPYRRGLYSFAGDTRFTQSFAERHGMTLIINQDIYMLQDFSHYGSDFDKRYNGVDLDKMRVMSFSLLSEARGPKQIYDVWNMWHDTVGIKPYMGLTLMNFLVTHAKSYGRWLPKNLNGKPANDPLVRQMVDNYLNFLGYHLLDKNKNGSLQYGLEGVYPSNIHVQVETSSSYTLCNDCYKFMTAKHGGKTYQYIAVGRTATNDMRYMDPQERIIYVPITARMEFFGPWTIKQRKIIHKRGVHRRGKGPDLCGAPDQNKATACGYLESSKFDEPY